MKPLTIFLILVRLALGGMMLYGGYKKFAKPMPAPTQMIEQIEKEGTLQLKSNEKVLTIKNYIFGMKQSGFFWQFLGICEIILGLMLISQYFSFAGAVMLVPITLHIFLFHLFLEGDETGELIETGAMLAGNLLLIGAEYKRWKHLVFFRPW